MKPRSTNYATFTKHAALTTAVLAGLMLGGRAQAQSTGAETSTVRPTGSGGSLKLPPAQTFIAVSPDATVFQFKVSLRDANGFTHTDTHSYAGTTLLAEKLFSLPPNHKGGSLSSASIGAWYWYHNSNIDRLALYGKYFLDNKIGFLANVGGDTHLGLFEYYGFVLDNVKNQTPTSPFGVQIGIGPYFNRRSGNDHLTFSGGDTGVAALLGLSYAPKHSPLSYSAELRYINYHVPARDLGISTTDSLVRFYAGVTYNLNFSKS
ncbi:MAG: hypothetical protein ACRYFS_26180 [Janthinobacterium lividum]